MDIINNRYRIVKKLSSQILNVEEFHAVDFWTQEKEVNLKIIPFSAVSGETLSFIKDEFITVKSIDDDIHIKNIGFASLYLSSFHSLPAESEEKFYILTTEYLENYVTAADFIVSCSVRDILDITVSLFQALTYIRHMGIEYESFAINDIFIVKTGSGFKIKIKDIITKKLENPFSVNFVESPNSEYTDKNIRIVGSLIISLLAGKQVGNNFSKALSEVKKKYKKRNLNKTEADIFDCLCAVAKQAAESKKGKNNARLSSLLSDINSKLNLNYTIASGAAVKRITFAPRIVGREAYTKKILTSVKNMDLGHASKNVFIVKGPFGIGKTRFLQEITYRLSLEYANVYFNYHLNIEGTEHFWEALLEKVFLQKRSEQDMSIKDAISKSIEYIHNQRQRFGMPQKYGHLRFKAFNEGKNLFFKLMGGMPVFLIIDDLHLADDFILETILYLAVEITQKEKLCIVLSYDTTAVPVSSQFESFLKSIQLYKNIETFSFSNFSEKETTDMVKNILLLRYPPRYMGPILYKQSKGYPLFIIEIIKTLLINKLLFINEKDGMWYLENFFDNEKDVSRKIIETALKNQLKLISRTENKLLLIMALFQNAVKIRYLYHLLPFSEDGIDKHIALLVNKAFITEVHIAGEIGYSITNKMLKDILYQDTDIKTKIAAHKAIIKILQKDERTDINEIIWHLEKTGDKKNAVKYCVQSAVGNIKNKKMHEAVLNYTKALSLIDETDTEARCNILLKISLLYSQLGLRTKENETLKAISEVIPHIENCRLLSLYYYQAANYEYVSEQIDIVFGYIVKLKTIYEKCKTKTAAIHLYSINCMYYKLTRNIEELKKNSYEIINLCGNNAEYLTYKCEALLFLGDAHYIERRYKECFKNYTEALRIARECNCTQYELTALCDIAILYSFNYANMDKAFRYMRVLINKARSTDMIMLEIFALLNYTVMLIDIHNNKSAYEYAKEADIKITAHKIHILEYARITNSMIVALNLNKYDEFFKYKKKAFSFLNTGDYGNKPFDMFSYYNTLAEAYQKLCHNRYTYRILKRLLKLKAYRSDTNLAVIYFWLEAIRIILNKKTDIHNLIKYFESYEKILDKNSKNDYAKIISKIVLDVSIALTMYCPDIDFSPLLFKLLKYKDVKISGYQYIAMMYFESCVDKKNEEVLLINAVRSCSSKGNINLFIVLNVKLGMYYVKKRNTVLAVMNFLEAENKILRLFKNIPKKYRLYLYNHSFYRLPFEAVNNFIEGKNIAKPDETVKKISKAEFKKILSLNHIKILKKDVQFKKELVSSLSAMYGFKDITYIDIFKPCNEDFMQQMKKFMFFLSINLIASQHGLFILNNKSELVVFDESDFSEDIRNIYELILKFGYDRVDEVKNRFKKTCIIIPIKKKNFNNTISNLLGFMVFVSESVINNFSGNGLKMCKDISNLFAILIESNNLRQTAFYDSVTGALTRKYFEVLLKDTLKKSVKTNSEFSLIIYDLDKFKNVNDTFGHHIGDIVLQNVTKAVSAVLNTGQILGRFGGEEFIIIIPGIGKEKIIDVAETIRTKVEGLTFDEKKIKTTISLGIACYPEHGGNISDLLLKADQALYSAKNSGRNRSCLWSFGVSQRRVDSTILGSLLFADETRHIATITDAWELFDITKTAQPRSKMFSDFAAKLVSLFNAESCAIILTARLKTSEWLKFNVVAKLGFTTYAVNQKLVYSVLNSGVGIFQIDWDTITGKNVISNMPEWNSVCITPLIKNEIIIGVVYLAVSEKKHEFNSLDFTLLRFIADIVSANI